MLKGFGFALSGPARGGVASASASAAPVHAQSATNVAPASAIFGPGIFMIAPSSFAAATQSLRASTVERGSYKFKLGMPSASGFEPSKQRIWDGVVAMQHK